MKKIITGSILIFILTLMISVGVCASSDSIRPLTGTGSVSSNSALNVRSGPGQDYDKLGSIPKGGEIIITGISENGWYRIEIDGQEGYVYGDYVDADVTEASEGDVEDQPREEGDYGEPEEGYHGFNIKPSMLRVGIAVMAIIVIVILMVMTLKNIFLSGDDEDEDEDDEYDDYQNDVDYPEDDEYIEDDGEVYDDEDGPYDQDGEPYYEDDEELYDENGEPYDEDGPYDDEGELYDDEDDAYDEGGIASEEEHSHKDKKPASFVIREEDYRVHVDPSFFDEKEPIEQPDAVTGYLEQQRILEAEKAAAEKSSHLSEAEKKQRIDDAMRKLNELQEEINKLKND